MIPLKPSLVIESPVVPSGYVQAARPESRLMSSHSYISSFRSLLLDIQIYSPFVNMVKQPGTETPQSRPVFCDQEKIGGRVTLDPSCSQSGRLTISMEGTFKYSSFKDNPDDEYPCNSTGRKHHRHVFLSSSATIPISPASDPRSTIREALSVRKRPSATSLRNAQAASRSCEFSFELPRGSRLGEEMPSSFSSKTPHGDWQGQSRTEEFEIAYCITAVWEESSGSRPKAILEAPVLFRSETDCRSFHGSAIDPEFWVELPLSPERSIPFNCAVTLPSPQSFSRCSSIPYFVVFATNDGLLRLVKEIAADATITVSLIRKITTTPRPAPQSPAFPDTPPASDDSDSQTSFTPYSRLLKRSVKSTTRSHTRKNSLSANKPLPELPQDIFSVSRTLETQLFIGFPKRPRANGFPQNLPDGLCRGGVQLSKDMLPSADWPGISVEYFLDVSVLVGQDDVRTHVPIKIY